MILHKDRPIDQYNRIERPETSPQVHSQMILNKGSMTTQRGKNSLFNTWYWEKLYIHIQKNEVGPLSYTIYNN